MKTTEMMMKANEITMKTTRMMKMMPTTKTSPPRLAWRSRYEPVRY